MTTLSIVDVRLNNLTSFSLPLLKIIVGITGASGVIYGHRLLEILASMKIETHLIVSKSAELVIGEEMVVTSDSFKKIATHWYDESNLSAPVASGSYKIDAMVIAPCSMKTAAGIANGYAENLILRSADVVIKQQKKLILVPRETPFSSIHLRNMSTLAKHGVTILPASPGFYSRPQTINDMVDFVVGKVLDSLEIEHALYTRWNERR